jgi:hypothetical protein
MPRIALTEHDLDYDFPIIIRPIQNVGYYNAIIKRLTKLHFVEFSKYHVNVIKMPSA